MGEAEIQRQGRLDAVGCLRNAHGHIAAAYAQLDDPLGGTSREKQRRAVRETLDAVDWIRRALERMPDA